jgi:KDO2-lipid IV(A) lauroyltransferase
MLALIRWLSRRSPPSLHALGALLGGLAWLVSPVFRRTLKRNADLAGVSATDRRRSVAEAGRMLTELPRLWLRPADQRIADPLRWEGAELIEQQIGRPGGLLLLTPHMGSFEMAGQAVAERFGSRQPMTVLYRPARQAWLRELEETARARPGMATAPANLAGVRQMIRALRRGETVGLLPDQVPPGGQGVWAPFFGQPAYTMTLAARLAQQTGAQILVLWCERLGPRDGYVVRVSALPQPLPSQADGDEALQVACATAINRAMEQLILQNPSQYLWPYQRYKEPRGSGMVHG